MSAAIVELPVLADRHAGRIVADLARVIEDNRATIRFIADAGGVLSSDAIPSVADVAAVLAARFYAEIVFANAVRDPEATTREILSSVLRRQREDLLPIFLDAQKARGRR